MLTKSLICRKTTECKSSKIAKKKIINYNNNNNNNNNNNKG